jgi:hypothetical protein
MIVAAIALCFALAGTAVAADPVGKLTKSKVKSIARKQADKELKANISGSHVNEADHAKNADNATNANHANSADTANTANTANTAGSARANNVYFARVNGTLANPTLAAGSPGVTVNPTRPGVGTGLAAVNFPVNMNNCAISALAIAGGGDPGARQSDAFAGGNEVVIATYVSNTGVLANFSFNVTGVC